MPRSSRRRKGSGRREGGTRRRFLAEETWRAEDDERTGTVTDRDVDAAELRIVDALEIEQVPPVIDDGNRHVPLVLLRLGDGGRRRLPGVFQRDALFLKRFPPPRAGEHQRERNGNNGCDGYGSRSPPHGPALPPGFSQRTIRWRNGRQGLARRRGSVFHLSMRIGAWGRATGVARRGSTPARPG